MTTARQAFESGVAINLVGVFFDTAAVLAAVRGYAQGDLAERAAEQQAAAKAGARQTKAAIETIRAAIAPAALPDPPAHPDAYADWAQACSEAVYSTLDEPGAHAYTAGWWIGAWLLAANLVALGLYLGDADPTDGYLAEVVGTYAQNAQAAAQALAETSATAPESIAAGLHRASELIQAAPPAALGEGSLELAGAWQEPIEQLDAIVQEIAAALG